MAKTTSSTDPLFNSYVEKRKVLEDRLTQVQAELDKLDAAAETFGLIATGPIEIPKFLEPAEDSQPPFFITAALQLLRGAPPGSHFTTREVQNQVEARLKRKFEKSLASSSLGRLAQEGAVVHVARNQWRAK